MPKLEMTPLELTNLPNEQVIAIAQIIHRRDGAELKLTNPKAARKVLMALLHTWDNMPADYKNEIEMYGAMLLKDLRRTITQEIEQI